MSYRIAIVDDDAMSLAGTKELLTEQGMRVTCLRSGEIFMKFIIENTPDLVLLDIMMPENDGFEIYRMLRGFEKQTGREPVPVIFLSGEDPAETEPYGLRLGADDYIRKPCDPVILKDRIERAIRNRTMIKGYTDEISALHSEKEQTVAELKFATDIQRGALPNKFPAFPGRGEFDIYASMTPAKQVGGDLYDFFLVDDDHLALVIADVSGKGIPAALFMMSSKSLIKQSALTGGRPSEILEAVNRQICADNDANMFVTVWLGILEISTGKLIAANAGHEYPMLKTNGRYEILRDVRSAAVGLFDDERYDDYELWLKKGDGVFVYTDGVSEATDPDNRLFGKERILDALNSAPDASPENALNNVRSAVDDFVKGAPQSDDITMLAVTLN